MQEAQVQSLGQEDALEKEMATCSSILAWKVPWTEECGGLQFQGYRRRVGVDLVTKPSQHFLTVELKSLIRTIVISRCLPFQRKVDVLPIEYLQIGSRFSSMSNLCSVVTT